MADAFLILDRYPRWSACAGSAALEAVEPPDWPEPPDDVGQARELAALLLTGRTPTLPPDLAAPIRAFVTAVEARVKQCKEAGATTELKVLQRLDVGQVTTERVAFEVADAVLIAEYKEHATLDLFRLALGDYGARRPLNDPKLRILGLAALLKYGILQSFTDVGLTLVQAPEKLEWRMNPDDLYTFGAQVTEHGALALSLRDSATALSHLTPGEPQCVSCSASYRCPALTVKVVDKVIEETRPTPEAPPLSLTERLTDPAILADARDLLPLVEAWCAAVRMKAADSPPLA